LSGWAGVGSVQQSPSQCIACCSQLMQLVSCQRVVACSWCGAALPPTGRSTPQQWCCVIHVLHCRVNCSYRVSNHTTVLGEVWYSMSVLSSICQYAQLLCMCCSPAGRPSSAVVSVQGLRMWLLPGVAGARQVWCNMHQQASLPTLCCTCA
jgi:hypothetical protein